jgi:hypothetical protein
MLRFMESTVAMVMYFLPPALRRKELGIKLNPSAPPVHSWDLDRFR